jgi:signal-transduction protein with cAMP-binding, CBS, and nucleotidyltransferase domain
MTADPITVTAGASLVSSLNVMFENRFRHLPVLEDERVLGVLSCRDIPAEYWMMRQNWDAAQNELRTAAA